MRLLLALAVAVLTPCALRAAVVEMIPRATAILNMDFSPIVFPVEEQDYLLLPREEPYLIQVDVWMRIRDLQPGQLGFSNTAFNVDIFGDGASIINEAVGLPAWNPRHRIDEGCHIIYACVPLWMGNVDTGANRNDAQAVLLEGITSHFGPPELDPRRTLGQDEEGANAGAFYMQLSGAPGTTATARLFTPWGASTYDENGFSSTAGNSAMGGRTQTFVVVPEPSCLLLILVAAPAVAYKFRK